MPTRIARRVLVLASVLTLLAVATVQGTHSPTAAQAASAAAQMGFACIPGAGQLDCTESPTDGFPPGTTTIVPAAGPLLQVITSVQGWSNGHAYELLPSDRVWMAAIQSVGCVDAAGVRTFLDGFSAAFEDTGGVGTHGPQVLAECTLSGSFTSQLRTCPFGCYTVTGTILAGAFPTPTPAPTPAPTPRATPTPTPSPSPTPTATPTPSPTPTASASESASGSASEEPSASPEGTVGGIVFTPEPSVAPLDEAPAAGDSWSESVPRPSDVSTDPAALMSSALLAFLLLLFMGFVGELFNNTAKVNYDVLAGWWRESWLGRRLRWFTDFWKSP